MAESLTTASNFATQSGIQVAPGKTQRALQSRGLWHFLCFSVLHSFSTSLCTPWRLVILIPLIYLHRAWMTARLPPFVFPVRQKLLWMERSTFLLLFSNCLLCLVLRLDDEFGGIVAVCQGAIAQYTTGGNGTCFGAPIGVPDVESWAFDSLTNGTCQAVWSSTPQPNSSSTFNVFPQPTKVAPTSFFRATDLTSPPVTTTGTTTGTSTTTSGDTTSAGPSTSAGISHRNLRTRFVWVAALAFTACWPLLY